MSRKDVLDMAMFRRSRFDMEECSHLRMVDSWKRSKAGNAGGFPIAAVKVDGTVVWQRTSRLFEPVPPLFGSEWALLLWQQKPVHVQMESRTPLVKQQAQSVRLLLHFGSRSKRRNLKIRVWIDFGLAFGQPICGIATRAREGERERRREGVEEGS